MNTRPEKPVPTALRCVARCVPHRWLRVRAEGSPYIPERGPVLVASRHYHHLYDGIALLSAVPRPIHFVVTLDWVRSAFMRRLMIGLTDLAEWPVVMRSRAGRQNFSSREMERILLRGTRNAIRLLTAGSALVVFPEGYPNVDPHFTPKRTAEEFLPFNPGFARIAALASRRLDQPVPVVPAGIHFREAPTPEITVRFGKPVFHNEPGEITELVASVEAEVIRLSGEGVRGRGRG